MRLIEPVTGGIVEASTDEAARLLMSRGFKPVSEKPKPKRTTRKKTKE